ncbi:hypothetical protein S83_070336, partial [Arachis hypogaea]
NPEGQNPKSFEEPQSSPQHFAKNPSPPKNIAGARDASVVTLPFGIPTIAAPSAVILFGDDSLVASLSGGDFLRVHTVDSEQPLYPKSIFSENDEDSSPKFRERRGVLHLFRSSSHSSIPSPSSRSSLVFILTVPNHISFDDLIRWCGPYLHHLHRLLFIRYRFFSLNKENESIDVCVDDKVTNYLNGRDVQQVLHAKLIGVRKWDKVLLISAQKDNRMQFQRSGILTTLCDHSFQCPCVSKWTYLSCPILDEYNRLLTSQLETHRQVS